MRRLQVLTAVAVFVTAACLSGTAYSSGSETGAGSGDVDVSCSSELYKLEIDPLTGTYIQSAFKVAVQVTNTSGSPVFDVEASVILMGSKLTMAGSNSVLLAARLDDGDPPVTAEWDVSAYLSKDSALIPILFFVSCKDELGNPLPTRQCQVEIAFPAVKPPLLACSLSTNVTDGVNDMTIDFDVSRGDYEGEQSTVGEYTVFTLTAAVQNIGEVKAKRVKAMLLLSENFTLEDGETPIKLVSPDDINPSSSGTASWKIRPVGSCIQVQRNFEVILTAEDSEPHRCSMTVTMAEKGCLIVVDLPTNGVGATGQKIVIPVVYNTAVTDGIEQYRLLFEFNPEHVRFLDAIAEGTRTEKGWRGPRTQTFTSDGASLPDVVMVDDLTLDRRNMIRFGEQDTLVFLRFEVVFDPQFSRDGYGHVAQSELSIVQDRTFSPNRRILSAFNSSIEDARSDAIIAYRNGFVTVSSDCVLPLIATVRLLPNHPNPFNPSTRISYDLENATVVRLAVLDLFGREIRILDEGLRTAGMHHCEFDAEDLAGGVYFYQLRTSDATYTQRMLLLR